MIYGILIGILCTLFVEFILYMSYNIGRKKYSKVEKLSEADELRIKRMQQGFHNVIKDYDIDVAMGRREQI